MSSYKKIFLLGFIIVILLAIPFSIYLVQQRQSTTTEAAKATVLSIDPSSTSTSTDKILSLDIVLDPGAVENISSNQVSFAKIVIAFDENKLKTTNDCLAPNPNSPNTLTFILEERNCTNPGRASISLSIGADPTKALTTKAKIATLRLQPINPTETDNPTSVTFDNTTQVLSIASTDQTSENVLSTTSPATVTISGEGTSVSPTPTSSVTQPTQAPAGGTQPPAGSGGVSGGTELPQPTATPIPEATDSATITEPTQIAQIPTTAPTAVVLPPTGPEETIIGIGILGIVLAVIGGALLLL